MPIPVKLLIVFFLCGFLYIGESVDQFIQLDLVKDDDWSLTTYI
jgi:hypothetical protein